ncbi:MAG: hypothetical protein K2L42_04320 [Clostridia bacterium]|nr:hypothetical protein [Clostridia bacterium]
MGIRPEDAEISENGVLKAKVASVSGEEEKYAECDVNPDICLNVSTKADVEKGKEVTISVDAAKLYMFDAVSCLTLLERDGGYTQTGLPDADFKPLPYDEEQLIKENSKPKKQQKKK